MGCVAHDYGHIPGNAVHTEEIQKDFVFRLNKACRSVHSVRFIYLFFKNLNTETTDLVLGLIKSSSFYSDR